MHKKSTLWETSIRVGGVNQNETWKALNSTLPPQTMKYPLYIITLNEEEWKHIMQPIVKFGLTKDNLSSNLNTAVIYEPWSLVRIGIFDPLVIQRTGQIALIIEYYWKSTSYRPLLWDNLYNLQLESGRGGHILENGYTETQKRLQTDPWIREI